LRKPQEDLEILPANPHFSVLVTRKVVHTAEGAHEQVRLPVCWARGNIALPVGMVKTGGGCSMTQDEGRERLPEDRRKEVFLALVDAQDHETDVARSREVVAQRFGVSESQVRQIEREGLDRQWPPL
jgi:hypothetical protein